MVNRSGVLYCKFITIWALVHSTSQIGSFMTIIAWLQEPFVISFFTWPTNNPTTLNFSHVLVLTLLPHGTQLPQTPWIITAHKWIDVEKDIGLTFWHLGFRQCFVYCGVCSSIGIPFMRIVKGTGWLWRHNRWFTFDKWQVSQITEVMILKKLSATKPKMS